MSKVGTTTKMKYHLSEFKGISKKVLMEACIEEGRMPTLLELGLCDPMDETPIILLTALALRNKKEKQNAGRIRSKKRN